MILRYFKSRALSALLFSGTIGLFMVEGIMMKIFVTLF